MGRRNKSYLKDSHQQAYDQSTSISSKREAVAAWIVQLEAKTLGKLYGITPDNDNYFKPPRKMLNGMRWIVHSWAQWRELLEGGIWHLAV